MFGASTDIHDRKRAEETLKDADRRKDEFLAMLAHELRNPLAPIRNALQIMRLAAGDPAAVERALDVMERQAQQLVRLVDDLLDVTRIARGKIELRKEPVPLASVVESALETSRPLIKAAGHELIVSLPQEPVWLHADSARLAQVVSNLLNNAAKYTPAGGCIRLSAELADDTPTPRRPDAESEETLATARSTGRSTRRSTGRSPRRSTGRPPRPASNVVLRVRDTGVGIAAEMLPQIFEKFSQVERSLERSQGGLGIGLWLVQRLVELHGGTVEAQSEGLGRGSEFVVRLPVAGGAPVGETPTPAKRSQPAAPHHRRRVLVVEDNADAAESLASLLTLEGFDVRAAHDGLTAIHLARSFRPEVVLLDIGLPGMDGYEVARRLRQEDGLKQALLVALTGYGQDQDRRRSAEAGFDHHLVKPVSPSLLEDLLAHPQSSCVEPSTAGSP